jgi:hypothetical protein
VKSIEIQCLPQLLRRQLFELLYMALLKLTHLMQLMSLLRYLL